MDSLQIRDLGVLQGSSEYFHTRHVLANVGEVVLGQAADSKRRDVCAKRFKCAYVPEPDVARLNSQESEYSNTQVRTGWAQP